MKQNLRELPAIHYIQAQEEFINIVEKERIPAEKLTEWLQQEIEEIRSALLHHQFHEASPSKAFFLTYIFSQLQKRVQQFHQYNLRRVINGTGTILHTNLGRARLSSQAIEQVIMTASHYSNLEYNIDKGTRGSRHDIIESLLQEVTGAEAAMVVNNNAAAVLLILRALASEKEVIVSRGELVEIGGSFRVSSIMRESRAKLVEVGTTNKTHLYDYEQAITNDTSMMMKVHTSNFKTIGFTASVSTQQLVDLSREHEHVRVYEDLGSGALFDFSKYGVGEEPVVSKVLKTGVDIVSFSGDKLLGGPQAGIIVGKKDLIQKLKKHQLARVLRVDKMTLAALEATIKSYIQGDETQIPTIHDILLPLHHIKESAEKFILELNQQGGWDVEIKEETSQIGGGTMPEVEIPTFAVTVGHPSLSAQQLFDRLRLGQPAVVTRLRDEKVIIDFRTVTEEEISILVNRFSEII